MAIQLSVGDRVGVGTACSGCSCRLPLRFAQPNEEAALWECVACGAPFVGVLLPEMVSILARRIRLANRHFDDPQPKPLSKNVPVLLQNLAATEQPREVREKRRSPRVSGNRAAVALCLDANFLIVGGPVNGMIANLSGHGMQLVTEIPLAAEALVAQTALNRSTCQLLGRIIWSRRLGHGCYGVGVEWVTRFGRGDEA